MLSGKSRYLRLVSCALTQIFRVLPSTLILVMLALETLEYAAAGKMKQL